MTTQINQQAGYSFEQASVPGDNFTQLLGINDFAEVAGYHGAAVNQGLTLTLPSKRCGGSIWRLRSVL